MDEPITTARVSAEWRRTGQVALITVAWVLTLALSRLGPEVLWNHNPAFGWASLVLNVIVGGLVIAAYARLIRSQDELQRKIALDALAATFGLSLVLGFGYVVAHDSGLIPFDLELVWFLSGTAVLYTLATAVSWLRYRW